MLVKIVGIGSIHMMYDDTAMGFEISKEAIRSTVQVIAGDDLITWLEETEDDIECGHPGGDGECMSRRGYLGDVVLCKVNETLDGLMVGGRDSVLTKMAPGRVSAPCVVVLAVNALESRTLVYWN